MVLSSIFALQHLSRRNIASYKAMNRREYQLNKENIVNWLGYFIMVYIITHLMHIEVLENYGIQVNTVKTLQLE